MKNTRVGLGKGLGMGYKNIVPIDSHIHSLSAKGIGTKVFPLVRVPYGKKSTPKKDREYKLQGGNSPVGTIQEWKQFGKKSGVDKLHINEMDGSDFYVNINAKGQKDYMKAVVRFEDLNPDYPSSQMEGIVIETGRKFQDPRYINEKIDNTKRFYDGLLDNFGRRIKNPEIQKEFHQKLKEGRLDAMYDLQTRYDGRKSFYGKARVDDTGGKKTLFSYNTKVAEIDYDAPPSKRVKVFGLYSNTTTRHIKDFLQQNGVKVESSKQIMEDYGA